MEGRCSFDSPSVNQVDQSSHPDDTSLENNNEVDQSQFSSCEEMACTKASKAVKEEDITPISLISPSLDSWRIRGRCTSIEPFKQVKTDDGFVDNFHFTITDVEGSDIRLGAFGDVAVRYRPLIETGADFVISGGQVSYFQVDKKYNTTGSDYEIILDESSEITRITPEIERPPLRLTVCPLNTLWYHVGKTVDILAVVTAVYPVRIVGSGWIIRDVTLVDRTGTEIIFTFWNDRARQIKKRESLHQVIGIKGALVKPYSGKLGVGSVVSSRWEFNPNHPDTASLSAWFAENGGDQDSEE